jgi:predicted type IV restriction endonuclease
LTPPDQVLELIERFERNLDKYKRPAYKETQVRVEFIDPFFEALGWDVRNVQGRGEHEDMPDNQEKATQTVLEQAEVLCREWVSE